MALIIPVAAGEAVSDEFVLADGEGVSISLAAGTGSFLSGNEVAEVQYKANSGWSTIGYVRAWPIELRMLVLQAPGTFRVRRPAQARAVGVDLT